MKQLAEKMIKHALKSVDPYNLILEQLSYQSNNLTIQDKKSINLQNFKNIYLVGTGKGAAPMAAAMEDLLGERLNQGSIIVKYEHGRQLKKTKVYEAGHPIPDQNTLNGSEQVLKLVDKAGRDDLVIVLITGGGSALMEALPQGITLDQLAALNQLLLSSGASIEEINTIRKHISLVKGGQLAKRIAPAKTLSLILSDVIGDPLQSIASGPTAPDSTTFQDAAAIIDKYGLGAKVSKSIIDYINNDLNGKVEETPDHSDEVFKGVDNFIIGNNQLVLNRVKEIAGQHDYQTVVLTDRAEGETREIALLLSGVIKSALFSGMPVSSPACIILGGEPTVTIKGGGLGGRNQELALAMLKALRDVKKPFYFCSIGTDGTDGPTDAAGAWIDHETMEKVISYNLKIDHYLDNNDSYHFFQKINQLIITGPTQTNVMDLMFCLI